MDLQAVNEDLPRDDIEVAFAHALGGLPDEPSARAHERLRRLRATFATSLGIIAEMYQDRDWEHLTRDDGSPYASLAEVLGDTLSLSASMARRYVQGARDFYLPLLEMTVEGTRIEITSGDVATLGKDGIDDAVSTASGRLDGVEDPDEAASIIDESLADAKERKSASRANDEEWGDDGGGSDFEGFDPARSNPGERRDYGDDLIPDDDEAPPEDLGGVTYTGLEDDDLPAPTAGDATSRILGGAETFDSAEAEETLPAGLREVHRALRVLADMTPTEVSEMIDYDTRGVLVTVESAVGNVKRLQAAVETSPWFLSRMS